MRAKEKAANMIASSSLSSSSNTALRRLHYVVAEAFSLH